MTERKAERHRDQSGEIKQRLERCKQSKCIEMEGGRQAGTERVSCVHAA